MRCTSEAEISLLASSELLPRKSEPTAYLLCLCYLGLVRREESRRITVNTLLIILWSSIMKTETMEINMSLAVVNMFPQQFNIKRASNGTIWISYIISLFSVRIITPSSRETDI